MEKKAVLCTAARWILRSVWILYGGKDWYCRYGEALMSVSVYKLKTYALHISLHLNKRKRWIHHVWTVPVMFNPVRFINDPRYLRSGNTAWIVQDSNRRKADVKFVQNLYPGSYSDLKRRDIEYARKAWYFEWEEELFVNYGLVYNFRSAPWPVMHWNLKRG